MDSRFDKYRKGTISDEELEADLKTAYLRLGIRKQLESMRSNPIQVPWWKKKSTLLWVTGTCTCLVLLLAGVILPKCAEHYDKKIMTLKANWLACKNGEIAQTQITKQEPGQLQLHAAQDIKYETLATQVAVADTLKDIFQAYEQKDYEQAIQRTQAFLKLPRKSGDCISDNEIKQLLRMLKIVKRLKLKM
ncbi:MAG: hypothetical protein RLZZ628_2103 [Bacteroidota bacterium]|jgi:hypothetical protein